MAKSSDNSNLLMLAAIGVGGYFAYTQGWLSFLGISPPSVPTLSPPSPPVPSAAPASPQQITVVEAPSPAPSNVPSESSAAAEALHQSLVRATSGLALQPVYSVPRDPNRTGATNAGVSGIGNYRMRSRF